jgi:hypothetical protein
MHTHRIRLALVAVAVAAGAGCSMEVEADYETATGSFERLLTVTGPVDLGVRTGSGSVVVRQGDAAGVHVTGRVRARRGFLLGSPDAADRVRAIEANPPIVQDGDRIRLGGDNDRDLRHVSIGYELVVPAATSLRVRTGSGHIEIPSLDGSADVRTGSGRIALGRLAGAVTTETGSGSIEVLGAGEGLDARTGSGSIRARDLAGPVRASTGSGRIEVSYAGAGDGHFSSGSGSVTVSGLEGGLRVQTGSGTVSVEGRPAADWDLHAGSGRIAVRLPADAVFTLDARSNSGSVSTSHPITAGGSGPPGRNRLQGDVRGGGPRVVLSTGSGAIRVD